MKKILIPLTALLLCAGASFADDSAVAAEIVSETSVDAPAGTSAAETVIVPIDNAETVGYTPSSPKRLKYGRRVAYNNSWVDGLNVMVYSFDGESLVRTEYANEAVRGFGFEISAILLLVLTDAAAFNFAPGIIFRKPLNTKFAGVGELAVSFPALLEWRPFAAVPLHALAGMQADIPVYTRLTWSSEPHSAEIEPHSAFNERFPIDFGAVVGLGAYLNDRLALDARVVLGLADFDYETGRRLNQFTVSISYIR
jgi:hypothetical protein